MSFKIMFVLSALALSSVASADAERRSAPEPSVSAVSQGQTFPQASEETQRPKEEELDAVRERFMERMMNRAGRR